MKLVGKLVEGNFYGPEKLTEKTAWGGFFPAKAPQPRAGGGKPRPYIGLRGCSHFSRTVKTCNPQARDEKRQDSHRLLRLELRALARALLSERGPAEAVVRVLRRGFRHGRDQQHFLSTPPRANLQGMARAG